MEWLEPIDSNRTTIEPSGEGVWTGGAFVIDEGLWMADWESEFADRRRFEDQLYSEWVVDEIMKEAQSVLRWDGAIPVGQAYGARYSYSNGCKEVDRKMDEITKQKMSDYLELFEAIKAKISNEQIALAVLQEVAKDVRSDKRAEQTHEEQGTKNSQPATDKQKKFMKKLGIKFPANVTKQEASMLIDEERGRSGE